MTDDNTTPATGQGDDNTAPIAGQGSDDAAQAKPTFILPPHPNTTFDEVYFVKLLEGSISLTLEEKKRVVEAIPRLSIEQINELIKIFEEEKVKFAELEEEFGDDVAKLKKQREKELQIEQIKEEESGEADEDAAAAEALKSQMGL